MKRKLSLMLCLVLVLSLTLGTTAEAASKKKKKAATATTTTATAVVTYPVTINNCVIQGTDVVLRQVMMETIICFPCSLMKWQSAREPIIVR